jgi:hypothetical protein
VVAELIALKVDVIVTAGGTPSALAAKHATTTIPIVVTDVGHAAVPRTGRVAVLINPVNRTRTGLTRRSPPRSSQSNYHGSDS